MIYFDDILTKICEMNNIEKETINENILLNEMHFSKKELQDPKVLEKVLNQDIKNKKFTDIGSKLIWYTAVVESVAVIIAGFALPIPSIAGFIATILLIWGNFKLDDLVRAIPKKRHEKNMEKLKSSIIKLKSNSEDKLKKNPELSKLKEVISNCDNTLKILSNYYKEINDKAEQTRLDEIIMNYEWFIKWWKDPKELGWEVNIESQLFSYGKLFGVSIIDIGKHYIKNNINKSISCDELIKKMGTDDIETAKKEFNKYNIKKGIEIASNDDNIDFVDIDSGKFYSFQTDDKIYPITNIGMSDINKKDFIEADKILGYYKFSKCPDGVIPKKLEFKV